MIDRRDSGSKDNPLGAAPKLALVYFGLYCWELVISIDFEWKVLTRRKVFTWPMIFYFANRYCTFGAILSTVLMSNVTVPDCRPLFMATLFLTHLSLSLASVNLGIRTIALWGQDRLLTMALSFFILVHVSVVVIQAISAKINQVPGVGCVPSSVNHIWDATIYLYATVFDLVVLGLNAYKLRKELSWKSFLYPRTLTLVIFNQGVIYFIIACVVNVVTSIVLLLNNDTGAIASSTISAALCCSIVACRAVRKLADSASPPGLFQDLPHTAPTTGTWTYPLQLDTQPD